MQPVLFPIVFLFSFIYFVAQKGNEKRKRKMAVKTAIVRTRVEPKIKKGSEQNIKQTWT